MSVYMYRLMGIPAKYIRFLPTILPCLELHCIARGPQMPGLQIMRQPIAFVETVGVAMAVSAQAMNVSIQPDSAV